MRLGSTGKIMPKPIESINEVRKRKTSAYLLVEGIAKTRILELH
jgi:hypothetical protein